MEQPYYSTGPEGQPVVVQGRVVQGHVVTSQPPPPSSQSDTKGGGGGGALQIEGYEEQHEQWTKGEKQPHRCNDIMFALLFITHLIVIAVVTGKYFPMMSGGLIDAFNNGNNPYNNNINNGNGGNDRRMMTKMIGPLKNLSHSLMYKAAGYDDTPLDASPDATTNPYRLLSEDSNDNNSKDEDDDDSDDAASSGNYGDFDPMDVVLLVNLTGAMALAVTAMSLPFIMSFAKCLIQFALLFNVATTLLLAVSGVVLGNTPMGLLGFCCFALAAYYAWVVWGRIPFAAANLSTAVVAVRWNAGLAFFGYGSVVLLMIWTVWWTVTFVSALYVQMGCYGNQCQYDANGFVVFAMLVSYYWTYQVVKNHLHVTVAGTVGTWWFNPIEALSCCSYAVRDSFHRASTWSFGSICLGSFVVALIQASREFLNMIRASGDDVLLCCAECCLSCIESIAEYFNQWAFVFVGLYGYSFVEAGKNVINLFRTRGWTTIITDNLVDNVLMLVSSGIGIILGIFAILISSSGHINVDPSVAFMIGFFVGVMLSSVIMGILGSAVNTVIVCYAEAPAEFQQNHPQLSDNMRNAWHQAWPVDFKY